MNHIDFVLWVVGWAWSIALFVKQSNPREGRNKAIGGAVLIGMLIAWVVIAVLLWRF